MRSTVAPSRSQTRTIIQIRWQENGAPFWCSSLDLSFVQIGPSQPAAAVGESPGTRRLEQGDVHLFANVVYHVILKDTRVNGSSFSPGTIESKWEMDLIYEWSLDEIGRSGIPNLGRILCCFGVDVDGVHFVENFFSTIFQFFSSIYCCCCCRREGRPW